MLESIGITNFKPMSKNVYGMLYTPVAHVFSHTWTTNTPAILTNAGIRFVERMSTKAMCLPGKALSRFTTTAVLLMSNRFQVVRLDASTIAAKMIKFHIRGDKPNNKLIGYGMSLALFPFPSNPPIAKPTYSASPQPTGVGFSYLCPKPVRGCWWPFHRSAILPSLVMCTTKASSSVRLPRGAVRHKAMAVNIRSHVKHCTTVGVGGQHG